MENLHGYFRKFHADMSSFLCNKLDMSLFVRTKYAFKCLIVHFMVKIYMKFDIIPNKWALCYTFTYKSV